MCACPTKSGHWGTNAVGEEHVQNMACAECVQMCIVGERIQGLKGLINLIW